jgi:hypothetical protein
LRFGQIFDPGAIRDSAYNAEYNRVIVFFHCAGALDRNVDHGATCFRRVSSSLAPALFLPTMERVAFMPGEECATTYTPEAKSTKQ